jgi:hypothetical protein
MTTIRLDVGKVGNTVDLLAIRVRWPDGPMTRASYPSDWRRSANTGPLLAFFVRYKLWGLRGAKAPFMLSGGKGSVAAKLHHVLDAADNENLPTFWARTAFGTLREDPRRCRLRQLIKVPERGGDYVAEMAGGGLGPEDITIVWDAQELVTENDLQRLLGVLCPEEEGSQPPPRLSPQVALEADLELRLVQPGAQSGPSVALTDPGALPVRTGTRVHIEAQVNRPAYLYLLWITSEGVAQPLYPWSPGDWHKRGPAEPVTALQSPGQDPAPGYRLWWPIDTRAGVETLVLMACDDPWPETFCAKLPDRLKGFPRRATVSDPRTPYWFTCHKADCRPVPDTRLNLVGPERIYDPIAHIQSLLRDRLGSRCSLLRAVSFMNAGKGGAGA